MKRKINKKFLYSFLISPALLLASVDYQNEKFKKAIDNYNNRIFNDSYLVFKEYFQKDKLNENLKFMLARSAYELGKFEEAKLLYEELLKENPTTRIKLELAQTYFQQKKFDEAKNLYEEVLKDTLLPANVRKGVELTLASLEKINQKNFFKTTFGFAYGYDSNVDNNTRDDFVYLGKTPLSISEKSRKDNFKEIIASLNHTYKISDSLTIDNKLIAFIQDYKKENDNDLSVTILGTSLSYYQEKYKLSLALDYNYIWLDSRSYLKNYVLSPSFEYQISNKLINKNKIRFIKKDFIQEKNNFRDSKYYELQSTLLLSTNSFGTNTFGISFGTDNKDKGKAWNVDYNFASLKYENMYPLTEQTLLSTGIEYGIERYKIKETFLYKKKKKNNKLNLDLSLIHSIHKNLSFVTSFRYINNKSNQNLYQYDKYLAKANFYISF